MPADSLSMPPVLYTGTQWLIIAGLVVIGLGIKALITWWVFRDAETRGGNAKRWAIAAIITSVGTAIVWLIVRPDLPRAARATAGPEVRTASAAPATVDPYTTGFGEMTPDPRTAALREVPETNAPPANAAGTGAAAPGTLVVICPRCQNRLHVTRNPTGPTPLRCDNCGATGQL